MQSDYHLRLGFIGTGKVGTTLARLWHLAGYVVSVVYNRTPESAYTLSEHVNCTAASNPLQVVQAADVVFLTVPDDAIGTVARSLNDANWHGKSVVHTSGAKSIDMFAELAQLGAMAGSLHPAFPFANVETAVQNLPGASFAIEASDTKLQHDLEQLVAVLDGQSMVVPPGKKAAYHAAMVVASNYTVVLYAAAQRLLLSMEMPHSAVQNALNGIIGATVENLRQQGIPAALTGPLVRDDIGTIKSHLTALDDEMLQQAYRDLARLAYPILEARNLPTHNIEQILQQEK